MNPIHDDNYTESESKIFCGIIPTQILTHKELTQTAKLVYGVIAGFHFNNETCYISNRKLGIALNVSSSVISHAVRDLQKYKLIHYKVENMNSRTMWLAEISIVGNSKGDSQKQLGGLLKTTRGIVENSYIRNNIKNKHKKELNNKYIPENKNQDLELKLSNDFDRRSPEYQESLLKSFKTKQNVINFQLGLHAYADDILEKAKPIIFEPEFKSELQDVEASYIQNGNSVECSFKFKPKQELEQASQTHRLPLDNPTPSIVDDLGDEFVPELVLQNKEKFNALQEIKKGVISTNVHGDKIIMLKNGKTNSKSYRNLFFTDKEREKLKEYYERNGLKEYLIYGLVKLNDYPLSNLKNFTKYKSHYSVMIGWIAKACQEQKILDEREAKFKK